MSEAIPISRFQSPLDDSFEAPRVRMTPRDVHVPLTYEGHPDNGVGIVVKQDGIPLLPQRTVADLPIERRWAVQPDGELRDPLSYTAGLRRIWEETYRIAGQQIPKGDKFENTPQLGIVEYVSMMVSPRDDRKLIPYGYDPHATDGSRPDKLYDKDGESKDLLESLLGAFASPMLRKKMKPWEIELVESHLGVSAGSGSDGIVAKLEELNALRAAGDITPEAHSRRVAELTGAPVAPAKAAPAQDRAQGQDQTQAPTQPQEPVQAQPQAKPARKPRKKREPKQMACGEKLWPFAIPQHLRECRTCSPDPPGEAVA